MHIRRFSPFYKLIPLFLKFVRLSAKYRRIWRKSVGKELLYTSSVPKISKCCLLIPWLSKRCIFYNTIWFLLIWNNSRGFVDPLKVVDFFEYRDKYIHQGKGDEFLNSVKDIDELIKDPKVTFQFYLNHTLLKLPPNKSNNHFIH